MKKESAQNLRQDTPGKLRHLSSLAKLGGNELLTALLTDLYDRDPKVRGRVVQLLSRFPEERVVEKLLDLLGDETPFVRRRSALTLGLMGEIAVKSLLRVLNDPESNVRRIAYASMALGYTKSKSNVSKIIELLHSPLSEVRGGAAEGLSQTTSKQAIRPLIEALRDESPEVRKKAAFALGRIGDPRAIPALTDALKDPDSGVRWRVVYTLGEMKRLHNQYVFGGFLKALNDPDWNVRRIAVIELRHEEDRAIRPLIEALGDDNQYVRRYAAYGLGRNGDISAVPPLLKATSDGCLDVVQHARWALDKIAKRHHFRSADRMISELGLQNVKRTGI